MGRGSRPAGCGRGRVRVPELESPSPSPCIRGCVEPAVSPGGRCRGDSRSGLGRLLPRVRVVSFLFPGPGRRPRAGHRGERPPGLSAFSQAPCAARAESRLQGEAPPGGARWLWGPGRRLRQAPPPGPRAHRVPDVTPRAGAVPAAFPPRGDAGARALCGEPAPGSPAAATRLPPRGRVAHAGRRPQQRALPGLAWACSESRAAGLGGRSGPRRFRGGRRPCRKPRADGGREPARPARPGQG